MLYKILFFSLNEDSWIFCCFLFLVPFFCLNEDSWLLNYPPLFNIICSVIQFWLFAGEVAIDLVSFFPPFFSLFLCYFGFRLVSMVLIGFLFFISLFSDNLDNQHYVKLNLSAPFFPFNSLLNLMYGHWSTHCTYTNSGDAICERKFLCPISWVGINFDSTMHYKNIDTPTLALPTNFTSLALPTNFTSYGGDALD